MICNAINPKRLQKMNFEIDLVSTKWTYCQLVTEKKKIQMIMFHRITFECDVEGSLAYITAKYLVVLFKKYI